MGNFNRDRGGDRRGGGGFDRRNSNRGFNRGGGGSNMYKTTCSECGNACEVPFRPTGSKPVFCSSCFEKKSGGSRDRKPRFDKKESDNSKEILKGIKTLNYKLDELIKVLTPVKKAVAKKPAAKKKVVKKVTKKAAPKKKIAAKKPATKKKVTKKTTKKK